ncbi:MAG: hypothetical protein QM504_08050 [Pseudomonadota bacterium]
MIRHMRSYVIEKSELSINLPQDARIHGVGVVDGRPVLWVLQSTEFDAKVVKIKYYDGSAYLTPEQHMYIGTLVIPNADGGSIERHFFQIIG